MALELDDSLSGSLHQQGVATALVGAQGRTQLGRDGDGDVEIRDRQHLGVAIGKPIFGQLAYVSKRKQIVLFPIRLDNAVTDTNEAWAAKLRARNIGDFARWKEHGAYQKRFERVLRGLAPKTTDKG